MHFDIQLMYFPHDVPLEMGGTMLLPGSHFRRVNELDVGRYQNFLGQLPMVCKAGTLAVVHHGIWHCGRQNKTDRVRYMFKIRLNPAVRQLRLWNTDDLEQGGGPEIIYGGSSHGEAGVATILNSQEPWFEAADGRLEIVNRIKLWRFLTGDDNFDAHYWLTRAREHAGEPAGSGLRTSPATGVRLGLVQARGSVVPERVVTRTRGSRWEQTTTSFT